MNIIQFNADIKAATELARRDGKAYFVGRGDDLRIVHFIDGILTIETLDMYKGRNDANQN